MKRHLTMALLIFIIMAIAGCSAILEDKKAEESEPEPPTIADEAVSMELFQMEYVGYSNYFYLYRDKLTDILYLCYNVRSGYAGIGGLSYMPDPDTGLPMTYAKYVELKTNQNIHTETNTITPKETVS